MFRSALRCISLVVLLLKIVDGRQDPATPQTKPLTPVATTSIASNPDAFIGQTVTVTASVDRVISPTSFAVDQDAKASGTGEVVVLVELLSAPPELNGYVTVIGEVVRHDGKAAIRATSVLTAAMVDLARRPAPAVTASGRTGSMRTAPASIATGVTALGGLSLAQSARINPMIDLLQQKKPVFGLYAPSAPRPGRGSDATPAPVKTPADLAKEALAYESYDILFSGAMERNFDTAYGPFATFVAELAKSPARLKHPLVTKIPSIAADPARAIDNISRQLNLGVSTIVFVDIESADEVKQGIAAMRFKANGGTRPDSVGSAPAYWGVSEQEYRARADLWPINPKGELVNWSIVESKEGLSKIREIAAVKGIGALFPGAGTLRGVFTTVNQEGQRIFDEAGWEEAIQQVLSACKEFNVACGYPATEKDVELRMKQGFSVFIINWGEAGFRTVEIGRKAGGR